MTIETDLTTIISRLGTRPLAETADALEAVTQRVRLFELMTRYLAEDVLDGMNARPYARRVIEVLDDDTVDFVARLRTDLTDTETDYRKELTMIEVGDRIKIYTDPITKTRLDGVAVVREINDRKDCQGYGVQYRAMVEFDDEPGEIYGRWIYEDEEEGG